MRYIKIDKPGPLAKLELSDTDIPEPKAHEVLIRVMAAGVNRPDIMQRQGKYPPPKDASPILGLEVAGEIVKLGAEVNNFKVGDLVCALTNGGGYAEYCTAPFVQCLPWPKGYDALHAAAIPENYFTVWANIFEMGRLAQGESLLVHGGSSGIGITAIKLAAEFGSVVYATAGTDDKCQACIEHGAKQAINYHKDDFEQKIKEFSPQGVSVILDIVGAPYMMRNLRILATDGRLIEIATIGGHIVNDFNIQLIIAKRLIITGSGMRARTTTEKGDIAKALFEKVWPVLDQGRCRPEIFKTFLLSEASLAHALMESSSHIGKIILKVAE
jgi:NADPH2:quinone reductase